MLSFKSQCICDRRFTLRAPLRGAEGADYSTQFSEYWTGHLNPLQRHTSSAMRNIAQSFAIPTKLL
eukprot:scaffold53617_cov24-Tisochrysis_lutea.AAC.1